MRKLGLVLGVVLMAASAAQAMTAGPGGRLYFTYWVDAGTLDNVGLQSIVINTDWTVQNAEGSWDQHGVIYNDITNSGHTATNRYYCISPEIYKPGGSTLGAYGSLMMGVGYKGDPANTMSLLEIQPSAGGNTVTVVGVGKADDGGPHTTYGFIGAPDPAGGFTGSSSAYVVTSSTSAQSSSYYVHIVQDGGDGGTDPMNDNAEYIDSINGSGANEFGDAGLYDFEIAGNRIYLNGLTWSAAAQPPLGIGGIGYYERSTNTLTKQWYLWVDQNKMKQVYPTDSQPWSVPYDTDGDNVVWRNPGTTSASSYNWATVHPAHPMGGTYQWNPPQGLNTQYSTGFAAGKVLSNTPGYEGYKDAVWTLVANGTWNEAYYAENVTTGNTTIWKGGGATNAYIAMFVDLDGDGYAMDNTIGEVVYLTHDDDPALMALLPTCARQWSSSSIRDLELVQNPADNKLFLVGLITSTAWQAGKSVFVLELEDNGDWAGDAQMIMTEQQGSTKTLWTILGRAIEFDAVGVVIPEPGTLLLLGTSALGVIGYIRRRRMK